MSLKTYMATEIGSAASTSIHSKQLHRCCTVITLYSLQFYLLIMKLGKQLNI